MGLVYIKHGWISQWSADDRSLERRKDTDLMRDQVRFIVVNDAKDSITHALAKHAHVHTTQSRHKDVWCQYTHRQEHVVRWAGKKTHGVSIRTHAAHSRPSNYHTQASSITARLHLFVYPKQNKKRSYSFLSDNIQHTNLNSFRACKDHHILCHRAYASKRKNILIIYSLWHEVVILLFLLGNRTGSLGPMLLPSN